uniref:Fc receptor like 6 n=1 Tax=Macaca mulatta TaxID=9544 RepID=F6U7Q7_MACMU
MLPSLVPCVGKTAWLYLQAWPNPVFEGDALTLQCQGWKNTPLSQVKFYRDGKFLHFSKENQTLSMGAATVQSRGQYSCTGQVWYIPQTFTLTSETTMVQVQGSQVLSTPTSSNWLVPWLPASLLGMMVIAAALLVYLRPWRKAGPFHPSYLPQLQVESSAHYMPMCITRKRKMKVLSTLWCIEPQRGVKPGLLSLPRRERTVLSSMQR